MQVGDGALKTPPAPQRPAVLAGSATAVKGVPTMTATAPIAQAATTAVDLDMLEQQRFTGINGAFPVLRWMAGGGWMDRDTA